ncbi:lipoprotein, putative [Aliivibrio fischeri ES114]|uniref:Lipoprotein, putative n=1 Tax=Aliivibrio fischeri (strain ATCC 700601 / ES114) TaxID=312309 RepID=Q5E1V0_ALIF1|nr:lipoprotein [Aliivibrio fischeri]AAW86996.1 lipoprotein, putative [Aliivibrio fischeri ES114]KLU77647.1 hypothetical protein AB192_17055 [Aliivibrio fischeri]
MKKVSLLAASVALALVGCGGSDGGSDTNTGTPSAGGIVITGFDGYFKNAVVFDDMPVATRTSTVGKLDSNDTIFGLTDGNGKITLPKNTEIKGTLSLQTITPNGDVQKMLIARDPSKFAGIYTIDMDHPTQAMAHEVSFRTLSGEKIISPLTDLVAAKAGTNPTPAQIKQAKKEVNTALGLDEENTDVFSDVIAAGDHALHKTAQILTESKVEAGNNYTPTAAIAIAEKATEIVKDPENADKLDQPNFKPTIPVDNTGTVGEVIINNKLVVSKTIYDNLIKQVNSADKFTDVTEISLIDLPIAELFVDADNKNEIIPEVKISTVNGSDVTAEFNITKTATELTISAKNITTVRDTYIVTLSSTDIAVNDKNMGVVSTTFKIKVDLENSAPTLNLQVKNTLQEWLGSLELQQNVAVFDEKMRISDLFEDEDKLTYSVYSSVAGLEFALAPFNDGGTELEILGKPNHAYPAGETITISATDGINTVYEEFTLAAIAEAGITINEIKYVALQEKITDITLKKGTPIIEAQLNITELFNTESVNGLGAIEYYAGLEDKAPGPNGENLHEGFTTVDGVNVNVDTNGTLTIYGEPNEIIKGGYFYLMAGVNGDTSDEISSKMVKITLSDVQPADGGEIIPPETSLNLQDKYLYKIESGNFNGVSGLFCDIRYYDSSNKKFYMNIRTEINKELCTVVNTTLSPSNQPELFEEVAEYTLQNGIFTFSYNDGSEQFTTTHSPLQFDIGYDSQVSPFSHYVVRANEVGIDNDGEYESAELYSLYLGAEAVEEVIAVKTTHQSGNDHTTEPSNFRNQMIHYTDNNEVSEFKVEAQMRSLDFCDGTLEGSMCEQGLADADLIIKDMSCSEFQKAYNTPYVNGEYFINEGYIENGINKCGIDFYSESAITSGFYTFRASPKNENTHEEINFSFKKD